MRHGFIAVEAGATVEERMNKAPVFSVLALLALCAVLQGQMSQSDSGCRSATVVSLKNHMMPADFIGGVIDNEIPQPQRYIYDLGIRLDCDLYVGRYESTENQTPSLFDINHNLNVRIDDGLMILGSPPNGRTLKTVIVSDERATCRSADK